MVGTVLSNRYELVEQVGIGGMAIVYKALDKLLNRYVAVKLLRSEFQDNEEFIRRFNIESQAAASLSHANIVSIYDVGQSGALQYIIMEFIEGPTLKDYISEKKGNIYWKDATNIAMQICAALEHAHAKHIIHRDIKPQNIMINSDGVVKVTDFGIARAATGGTTTMEAMGSAHYLSPEQARGGYTDQKSDIYSLGVVLYELYTGKLPFDGETPVAVAMQHMQTEPIKPRTIKADIPKSIENIILKAMSKEQRLRYENASMMLSDIKKAYTDPDTLSVTESDADKFGTKKIPPIVNITMPTDSGKQVVRRSEDERIKKQKQQKKTAKKDVVAIVAAVIACFVLACLMGIMAASCAKNASNAPESTNQEYSMPNVLGLSKDQMNQAINKLREAGFAIEIKEEFSGTFDENEVISQEPKMGPISEGTRIVITISKGKESINLDDFTGKYMDEAILILEEAGIVVKTSEEMSDDIEEGYVIRQLPTVGQIVKTGDSVRLFVSSGPNKFSLADYKDMKADEAKTELEMMGIKVTLQPEPSDSVTKGLVIKQSPDPGTEMKKGDSVTISVSDGPAMITVPKLIGLTLEQAENTLINSNLKRGEVRYITSGAAAGTVVKQSVSEGTKVEKNTIIDISVADESGASDPGFSDTGL